MPKIKKTIFLCLLTFFVTVGLSLTAQKALRALVIKTDVTLSGDLDMNDHIIKGVKLSTASTSVATRDYVESYVDAAIGGGGGCSIPTFSNPDNLGEWPPWASPDQQDWYSQTGKTGPYTLNDVVDGKGMFFDTTGLSDTDGNGIVEHPAVPPGKLYVGTDSKYVENTPNIVDGTKCGYCKYYQGQVCVYVPENEDPFGDCGGASCCGYCNGSGSCSYVANGSTCTSPGDACTATHFRCDGSGTCSAPTTLASYYEGCDWNWSDYSEYYPEDTYCYDKGDDGYDHTFCEAVGGASCSYSNPGDTCAAKCTYEGKTCGSTIIWCYDYVY